MYRTLTHAQFLDIWSTRSDAALPGRELAVLPLSPDPDGSGLLRACQAHPLPLEMLTLRRL